MRALLVVVALAGCRREPPPASGPHQHPPSAAAGATHTVAIRDMKFDPATLDLAAGDRVTWKNEDLVPHTATDAAGGFDSDGIAPQASWTWTAAKAGRVDYTCRFHPTMKGSLVVK